MGKQSFNTTCVCWECSLPGQREASCPSHCHAKTNTLAPKLLEPAPPASRDSNCSARALYFLKYENTQIKFLSGKLSVAWWPAVCRDTCARSAPYCCRPFSPDVDLYADSRTQGYRSHFRDYPGHDGWSWRWSPSSAHATCLFESGAWGSVLSTSFWGEIWPENRSRWEVVSQVLIGEKLLK